MRATSGDLNSTTHSDQFKTVGKPAVFLFCNFYRCARKAIVFQYINKTSIVKKYNILNKVEKYDL